MRRIVLLATVLAVIAACGKDKATSNNPAGITVSVSPARMLLDLNASYQFSATVNGTDNHGVTWLVENIVGGDPINGRIDTAGLYQAPSVEPSLDSARITARSLADLSKSDDAWVILVDPAVIYVAMTGSDINGTGSRNRPYRTITKALGRAQSGQVISVGPGDYNAAAGEVFPLQLTSGIELRGAGSDSTYITGPMGFDPLSDATIKMTGDGITVHGVHVRSVSTISYSGVGIWLAMSRFTKIERSRVSGTFIGIYINGAGAARPILDGNSLIGDSIGIALADTAKVIIRNSMIRKCSKYGIQILDQAQPDLGRDTVDTGRNTIDSCGNNLYQWLIYNNSPDTIKAIGNTWQNPIPGNNDQFIRDDEESGGAAGPVILE